MENVIVRGSGEAAQKLKRLIEDALQYKVVAYAEPIKLAKNKSAIEGVPVISQYAAANEYHKGNVKKIFVPGLYKARSYEDIENELYGFAFAKEDIIVVPPEYNEMASWRPEQVAFLKTSHTFQYIEYLEYHVVDHCNLKCKNCTHFSSYVRGEVFADFDIVKDDLAYLKNLVFNIGKIRILGGECLLNPQLPEYIEMTRALYPYAEISIVTNGILVQRMEEKLINTLNGCRVELDLSMYPPMFNQIDKITDFLEQNHITYTVLGPIFNFVKPLDLEKKVEFPFETTKGQWGCGCYNIYKGKIAICPSVCFSFYYDEYHKTTKLSELSKSGIFDLHSIRSFDELKQKLEQPCELCNHCLFYRSLRNKSFYEKWEQE